MASDETCPHASVFKHHLPKVTTHGVSSHDANRHSGGCHVGEQRRDSEP
jgi:hypothetical protein